MALDTWGDIWNRVLLRAPDVGPFIAQDFVRNAFRRVAERRRWSWLIKYGQFISPPAYSTGTVAVTQGSATVTGTGTAWNSQTPTLLYQQFRVGLTSPIYTIQNIASDTSLTLDSPWGGATSASTTYRIYQCFFPVSTDFHSFLTLWDPAMNWQLYLNVKQEELNIVDSQRATTGNAYCVSYRDTNTQFIGYTGSGPGVPRYELWPHAQNRTFPYLYESRATDLQDAGATLPRFIRGDVLLEMALGEAASWPGPKENRNAYYNLANARRHDEKSEVMIAELERQDDETDMQDLIRQYSIPPNFAVPWGDAAYIQKHAVGL